MSRINRQLSKVDSVAVSGALSGAVLRLRLIYHSLGATLFWALLLQPIAPPIVTGQTGAQEDLRKQIGTIIVTPGSGPSLAVADFQARSAGIDQQVATFNAVLLSDLQFSGVSNVIGKSLYPKTRLADPASLRFEEWSGDPVKADYLAFGSLVDATTGQGFLYDVKTQQGILSAQLSGSEREMAHQFADQIVKLL